MKTRMDTGERLKKKIFLEKSAKNGVPYKGPLVFPNYGRYQDQHLLWETLLIRMFVKILKLVII
jgi:hypothetical protein